MAGRKQVAIIGAALDLGAGRRGVDMGPSAIRYAGLNERLARPRLRRARLGRRRDGRPRGDGGDGRERALPARDQGRMRPGRTARRARNRAGVAAARARRRPLGRAGDAGRSRPLRRRRRRALDRRPQRPEHTRDLAERQRARDAAGRRDRPHRPALRQRCLDAAGRRAGAHRARRPALGRRAGARADPRARDQGVHDERHRPDRDRAGDPGVADADRRARLRPRLARHGRARPRGRAGRRDTGARRPLLPGGAPRARARRGVGPRGLARGGRGRIRSSTARTPPPRSPSSWSRARSARRSSEATR